MTMETAMTATAIQNVRTRQEWAEVINADWRKSIEGIIQTGRDLVSSRKELGRGEFTNMVEMDLLFSRSAADKLMRISRHPLIASREAPPSLPPSWAVLSELASLSTVDFEDAQNRGLITPETSQRKARAIRQTYKTPDGEAVGEGNTPSKLPSPKEAREVARATNRMVAASDGRLYSGATDEEGAEHVRKRGQTYMVIDTINAIVENNISPKQWVEEAKDHWLHRFEFGRIEVATQWLAELGTELVLQKRLFDIEGEADGE